MELNTNVKAKGNNRAAPMRRYESAHTVQDMYRRMSTRVKI